jgi:rRNA maturation endonuclease Nob1
MTDTLLTIAVVVAVLVLPLIITNLFVRKMYYRCSACRSLNAKRRTNCRVCGDDLIDAASRPTGMTS